MAETEPSGKHVQAVYVFMEESRLATMAPVIQGVCDRIDAVYADSFRHHHVAPKVPRWVKVKNGTERRIISVKASLAAPYRQVWDWGPPHTSTGTVHIEQFLNSQLLNRRDRRYVVFCDWAGPTPGGAQQSAGATLRTEDNAPSYVFLSNASLDRRPLDYEGSVTCDIPVHEFTHSLGAVLSNVPGAGIDGHLKSGYDLMGWNGGNYPDIEGRLLLDPLGTSYFNPNSPPSGSYLATPGAVNLAHSGYLVPLLEDVPNPPVEPPAPTPTPTPTSPTIIPEDFTDMNLIYDKDAKEYHLVGWGWVADLTVAEGYALDAENTNVQAIVVSHAVWLKIATAISVYV